MSEGQELVARIVAEMAANGLEPDGKEQELLGLAEGLADRLAELEMVHRGRRSVGDVEVGPGGDEPGCG